MSAVGRSGPGVAITALPGYARLANAGAIGDLAITFFRAALLPPYSWRRDFVVECSTTIRRCVIPAMLSVSAFALGLLVIYLGSLVEALGTVDRLGGGINVANTREIAVWVTTMIVAGVAGSAMTADLASRKIRDELDALHVLGVDMRRSLIVPRILALVVVSPMLGLISVFTALTVGYWGVRLAYPDYVTSAGFLETLQAFTIFGEQVNMIIKMTLTGFIVGLVSCYKGLSSDGGAEGVGRAVNEAVLISFFAVWTISVIGNTIFSALFPGVQILRG